MTPDDPLSATTRTAASGDGGDQRGTQRWWGLVVLSSVQLTVALDATIVNIALPSVQAGLGLSDGSRHWVITAYALAFGGLLPLGGRVADRAGTRGTLLCGLIGFAATSALAGAAPTGAVLFAARAAQGGCAALLAPAALSLLNTMFQDPRERGTAFGVFGALSGAGAAAGLLAGGLLTETLSWRWCLYVNVPIALLALLGGVITLPAPAGRATGRLDLPGAATSCAGLAALVLGFARTEARGWGDPLVLSLLAAGVLLLVWLVRIETRTTSPLLPLRVLLHRGRGGAFLVVGLSQLALFGFFLFITYYLQTILGYPPVLAGVAFLPLAGSIIVGATGIAGKFLHRTGPRPLMTGGLVLAAVGMAVLTRLGPATENAYTAFLLPAQIAIGLGLGLVMMPAMSTATADVDEADSGVASALVNTAQQVGGAMGTALLNSVAALATAAHLATTPDATPETVNVHGFTTALAVATAILAVTAVLSALLLPRNHAGRPGSPEHDHNGDISP